MMGAGRDYVPSQISQALQFRLLLEGAARPVPTALCHHPTQSVTHTETGCSRSRETIQLCVAASDLQSRRRPIRCPSFLAPLRRADRADVALYCMVAVYCLTLRILRRNHGRRTRVVVSVARSDARTSGRAGGRVRANCQMDVRLVGAGVFG